MSSPDSESIILVLCNVPDATCADLIAHQLVEQQLAACVNVLPPVRSIYRWQGKVEAATELPLLIKTTGRAYPALQSLILQQHPYEVPELIVLPLVDGLPAYFDWVRAETFSLVTPTSI
ncbi:divalent-cation tolerance protein CutA [Parachitinimonas caeni]|uniref:Divalent-cation tolerance protein CutA n=1 Tax=Parachitinimonas caeni TaxID=3031301 RepID=A0ABT7DVY0_9NEIS|nr:divalent-cation tolerance protein CutA [Parachitinimonas caeni]MDK2124217.1 divalent-cation tolerance protein CutA [Parachitinimonas caeni]